MQLHNSLATRRREVPHFLWHQNKRTSGELVQAGRIVLFAHSRQKRPLQHGDIFILGMPVGSDVSGIGKL